MILGFEITNFDVFDYDRCGMLIDDSAAIARGEKTKDEVIRLRNLNALIGRNNTGKTSFLMALSFVKRCIMHDVASAATMDQRPGFSNLLIRKDQPASFKLFFRIRGCQRVESVYIQYEFTIEPSRFGSPIVSSEKIIRSIKDGDKIELNTILDIDHGKGKIKDTDGYVKETSIANEHMTALGVYGMIGEYREISCIYREISRWFFCQFSSDGINSYYADGNAPGGHKHLSSTGSNISNVLSYMKETNEENYIRVINEIKSKIPSMRKKKNLPKELEESPDKLFLYLLLLRDPNPHSTIFIETPDKDLYHDMVDVLADEMREFTLRNPFCQIIFSTHNPYIIESMSPREIWVFERDFEAAEIDGDGVSIRCAGLDPVVEALFKEGVGMGAIWYGGHLDNDNGFEYEE